MEKPRLETCATHGLRYDANQYDNCVLCRRLVEQPVADTGPAILPRVLIAATIGVCALVVLYFVRGGFGAKLSDDIPSAAARCVRPLLSGTQECIDACGARGGVYCHADCMRKLNDGLHGCVALPLLASGAVTVVTSSSALPSAALVQERIKPAVEALSECGDNRGPFTARIVVRPDKKISEVAVGSRQVDVGECISQRLQSLDLAALPGADYALVIRAQPPAGRPNPPREPSPNTPTITPQPKWESNKPNEEQVLVSRLGAAKVPELQLALKLARNTCIPDPQPACAAALSKVRYHFATIKQADQNKMLRFAPNTLGAGFDCVNIDTSTGFKHNTAVGVARPTQLMAAKWVLVSSSPLDEFTNPETFTDTHFKGMHSEFMHVNDAKTEELSICVSVDDDERGEWRLGLATYDRPAGQKYDWHLTDISALGLSAGASEQSKLSDAIRQRKYDEVQKLLKDGAKVSQVHGAIALAVRAFWDPKQFEVLLRAGASPNDLNDEGYSGMHMAAEYTPDQQIPEVLTLFRRFGGNVNLMTEKHGTPLHVAARMATGKVAWDTLIAAGANPNLKDKRGQTAAEARQAAEDAMCGCQ